MKHSLNKKVIIAHLIQKCSASYENRGFISLFARACNWTPVLGHMNPEYLLLGYDAV
jgi:hypothetical protein